MLSIFNTKKNKKSVSLFFILQQSNNQFHISFSKAGKECNLINNINNYVIFTLFKKTLSIFFLKISDETEWFYSRIKLNNYSVRRHNWENLVTVFFEECNSKIILKYKGNAVCKKQVAFVTEPPAPAQC